MATRRRYSEEFKREAVRLMETRGDRSVADVAESIGVAANLLFIWRRRYSEVVDQVRDDRGESLEEEVIRLRREKARLLEEREILKKAAAFFAKDNGR
jgi:transposase